MNIPLKKDSTPDRRFAQNKIGKMKYFGNEKEQKLEVLPS